LHVPVNTSGFHLDGGKGCGGLEPEPDILQGIGGTPAASRQFIGRSLEVGEFCIGRTSEIMRDLQRTSEIVIIQFIIQAEAECAAYLVIIHRDPVPVPNGQGICNENCGAGIKNIPHAGHFHIPRIEYGHLSAPHGSIHIAGLELNLCIRCGGLELEPYILIGIAGSPATSHASVICGLVIGKGCIT